MAGADAPIVACTLDVPSVFSTLAGSVTCCQARPFQCSMTGWKLAWFAIRAEPMAQASFAASAATSLSWIRWFLAWTLAVTRQLAMAAASAASAARAADADPAARATFAALTDPVTAADPVIPPSPADLMDPAATAAVAARTGMVTSVPASSPAPKQRLITQHLDLTGRPRPPGTKRLNAPRKPQKGPVPSRNILP